VIGDGRTDTSKFSRGLEKGSIPAAVYTPGSYAAFKEAESKVGFWVNYLLPRDFSKDFVTFGLLKEMIEKILNRSCTFRPSNLYDFMKGKVSHPDEISLIEKHLDGCSECQDYFTKTLVTPQGTIERQRRTIRVYDSSRYQPR